TPREKEARVQNDESMNKNVIEGRVSGVS
ncbi:hypothetical protein, partial [uncultured Gammaproteobacteria bacterium]